MSALKMPTLRQAKILAKYYRVPFIYFYLPDVPKRTKRIDKIDYRTFGNIGDHFDMSRELRWILRDIEERRDTMLALYEANEQEVKPFTLKMDPKVNHQIIADAIRNLLEITHDELRCDFRYSISGRFGSPSSGQLLKQRVPSKSTAMI